MPLFVGPAGAEQVSTAAFLVEPDAVVHETTSSSASKKFEFVLLDNSAARITYSRKGLAIRSRGGNYEAVVRGRVQLRFADPYWKDPAKESDFGKPQADRFGVRRARLKVEGHAFRPWVGFQYEHDVADNEVLNLMATVSRYEWLQFRGGQWKPEFSRERVTSSGKQQFVERSIVNTAFTIDRQAGFEMLGHVMPGTRGDSWYYAGVFTGNGRGAGFDGDGQPMLMARYQWNFLGEDLGYSASDLEYHDSPAASVAAAGVTNRSRYTKFSSSGGGQLPGFEPGAPGQYSLRQLMGEFALKYRGLSVVQELHFKRVFDNVHHEATRMRGSYVQAGYFPHGALRTLPRQLEVGYRYGFVDPHTSRSGDLLEEHTAVVNWFFEGHNNKLTFDVGRVSIGAQNDLRVRAQWDVHF